MAGGYPIHSASSSSTSLDSLHGHHHDVDHRDPHADSSAAPAGWPHPPSIRFSPSRTSEYGHRVLRRASSHASSSTSHHSSEGEEGDRNALMRIIRSMRTELDQLRQQVREFREDPQAVREQEQMDRERTRFNLQRERSDMQLAQEMEKMQWEEELGKQKIEGLKQKVEMSKKEQLWTTLSEAGKIAGNLSRQIS